MLKATTSLALVAVLLAAAPAQAKPADPQTAKTILMDSVAIPTVEGRGRVPELAAYYARVLQDAGFAASDIVITPMGETATFAATLKGRTRGAPVLLLGHMDVVEADPKDWTRDPFVPVEEGGYLYGRGVEDNKFDIAMMVAALAQLKRDKYVPRTDVILVLSGDEETSMTTTRALAQTYKHAALALNGDGGGGLIGEDGKPKYYSLQAGEKTYADYELELTNPGGHSSRPGAVNAIAQMSAALAKIGSYRFAPQLNAITAVSLKITAAQIGGETGAAMARFAADPTDSAAADIVSADPEYIGQVRTTCVPTMVHGGHAENALPQRVTANINCRILPGVSIAAVQAELARVIGDPAVTIRVKDDPTASDASPLRADVVGAVTAVTRKRYPASPQLPIIPSMSGGATDSLHFRAAGVPSYGVSGLFIKASDSFAHGLNERVPVDSIPGALLHYDAIIRALTK
jgi:acetylornithine deacetylase/succinyl-diaminopimelate desuccinylase-like protein